MSTKLTFRKEAAGRYFATDDTYQYALAAHSGRSRSGRWLLQVRKLTETAGVRHALGQPVIDYATAATKTEMTAVANAYSAFGTGYRESEHGHQGRMLAAINAAYDQMGTL
jgi:hypothetical protein